MALVTRHTSKKNCCPPLFECPIHLFVDREYLSLGELILEQPFGGKPLHEHRSRDDPPWPPGDLPPLRMTESGRLHPSGAGRRLRQRLRPGLRSCRPTRRGDQVRQPHLISRYTHSLRLTRAVLYFRKCVIFLKRPLNNIINT